MRRDLANTSAHILAHPTCGIPCAMQHVFCTTHTIIKKKKKEYVCIYVYMYVLHHRFKDPKAVDLLNTVEHGTHLWFRNFVRYLFPPRADVAEKNLRERIRGDSKIDYQTCEDALDNCDHDRAADPRLKHYPY